MSSPSNPTPELGTSGMHSSPSRRAPEPAAASSLRSTRSTPSRRSTEHGTSGVRSTPNRRTLVLDVASGSQTTGYNKYLIISKVYNFETQGFQFGCILFMSISKL